MPKSRPRIAFIGTGGTIASVGHDSLDMIRYAERGEMLSTEALLARVPEMDQVAEIVIVPFPALISPAVGPEEWRRLHRAIHEAARASPAADVVIVEGSRAGSGRVPAMATLRVDDCVTADTLSPQKARILLLLALTVSDDPARNQAMFDRYRGPASPRERSQAPRWARPACEGTTKKPG